MTIAQAVVAIAAGAGLTLGVVLVLLSLGRLRWTPRAADRSSGQATLTRPLEVVQSADQGPNPGGVAEVDELERLYRDSPG